MACGPSWGVLVCESVLESPYQEWEVSAQKGPEEATGLVVLRFVESAGHGEIKVGHIVSFPDVQEFGHCVSTHVCAFHFQAFRLEASKHHCSRWLC